MFRTNNYSATIQASKDYQDLVEKGIQVLQNVVGSDFAPLINLDWNVSDDSEGRKGIILKMSDDKGLVRSRIPVEEFRNRDRLKDRLYEQFGDLLQNRSHTLLRELKEMVVAGDPE